MQLFDTHCHIQFDDYPLPMNEVIDEAREAGVSRLLVVGCRLDDSENAVKTVKSRENLWASIGLHPHEAKEYVGNSEALEQFSRLVTADKVVAIGECGLDFYYNHSPKAQQIELLEFQLQLAKDHDLPVLLHIRDAFDEFWPIFDNFRGLRGLVHSFTADRSTLDKVLSRGLYVGLNGIMTFTKNTDQLAAAKAIPLESLVLETDAPYLTPVPFRGTICQPKHVVETAKFLSGLRNESLEMLAAQTTANAIQLLRL